MTERKKEFLAVFAMLGTLLLFFSKILFTDKIIRAPDIVNEFYWGVLDIYQGSFAKALSINLSSAGWDMFTNSGSTAGGGGASAQFLIYLKLLFLLVPTPASVAWCIVLHLFFGAAGVYAYCRLIGVSRTGALFGGLVFALAPENASLINAGHVMKIATISFAPWAFYCFEKGFKTRRLFWFLFTALVLAFQFFNTHWQIAYYTCICIGCYGLFRSVAILRENEERELFPLPRLLAMNLLVMFFFLSTVAISLVPLADWSKDTNRGVHSGANQGKGGLDRDEAMSWSLPPEEALAFAVPGFFGLSRQEGGENPKNIASYYWGRMVFTQTTSYMGLLPWLLVPLPLIFRRDKYTWLATLGIIGGVLFSMGKYTWFYNLLFDYFPGINRFRVPKMMMFIPVMGLGLLSARGIDLLRDNGIRADKAFNRYLAGVLAFALFLVGLLGIELAGKSLWISRFGDILLQPTRYEQGEYLLQQRWSNLVIETGIAAAFATAAFCLIWLYARRTLTPKLLLIFLFGLYIGDVWRINDKFMFTIDEPVKTRNIKTPAMDYLLGDSKEYRVLPMNGSDPMQFVSNKVPVFFTSNAVQQKRWQDYLDNFSVNSPMADLMNLKYLVYSGSQYAQEKGTLGERFTPVFTSPDGSEIVLENRVVMPKAWLVPAVIQVATPEQIVMALQNPQFDPRKFAFVEAQPPMQLNGSGEAKVLRYEGERIDVDTMANGNTLLVLGEKYYRGWKARIDGKSASIVPVNYILRGVYLPAGNHKVEFIFDPLPFKIGKWLTLTSFAVFTVMLLREWRIKRRDR